MHDLTGFQRDLLRVIATNDGESGLTIKDHIEDYYGSQINHGRLYPNLDELVTMGLVEKGEIDKRTNAYSLTPRGARELRERDRWNAEHTPDDTTEETAAAAD